MGQSVLVVDDDAKLGALLKSYFDKEGFRTYVARNGLDGLAMLRDHKPDLMILDIMMPGLDGWEVCRKVRKDNDIPIIMLTARDEESDRLVGLEIGADDYVIKPFSPREVVARAKAILRRSNRLVVQNELIKVGSLELDTAKHEVRIAGKLVEVTPTEFKLLQLFAANPGRAFTRLQLVEETQGYGYEGYERTMDAHIKNLRRKVESNPKEPALIMTVHGIGYKFVGDGHE